MLELYTFHGATCGLKSRIAAEEKEVDYIHHAIERDYLHHPDYLKLNPKGVVPTLVHNGDVLVESSIIINYLDMAFDGTPLKPTDPMDQALMFLWMKRADEELLMAIGSLTYTISMRPILLAKPAEELQAYLNAISIPAYRERREQVLELGFDNPVFEAAINIWIKGLADMETALAAHKWLASDTYSLADTTYTPFLERLDELQLNPLWVGKHKNVERWWDGIRARRSYDACLAETPNPERPQHEREGAAAWPEIEKRLPS